MKTFNEKRLGYFGHTYELKVIKQIIGTKTPRGDKFRRDTSFGRQILRKLTEDHFDNELAKTFIKHLKGYYNKSNVVPWYDTLETVFKAKIIDDLQLDLMLAYLKNVQNANDDDADYVQENCKNFINTKNLYIACRNVQNYINEGRYDEYKEIAQKMLDAIVEISDEDELEAFVAGDHRDLNEGERHVVPTGIKTLDNDMNGGLAIGELALIVAALKVGKAQPNTCRIYTKNGYKLMGEIKVGDKILGSNGKNQTVLGVYPQGIKDIYKVEFSDNTHTFCCKEHLWSVKTKNDVRYNRDFQTLPLEEIMKNYKQSHNSLNYRIPMVSPVDFNTKELSINPYVMGVMIGDGSISEGNFSFSTADVEILERMKLLLRDGYTLNQKSEYDYYIKNTNNNGNLLKDEFRKLNLIGRKSNDKFIPKEYLYSSLEDRKELLRGLIDSDGFISKDGKISFTTVSKQLIEDFRLLILSLGGFCGKISSRMPKYTYKGIEKNGQETYRVNISFTEDIKIVSHLDRKQSRYKPRTKRAKSKLIKNIELVRQEECTCIKVSNSDELYVTDDFILTHNTTFASFIANNAAMMGYNVLQLFFEDSPEQVKLKHRSKFTGMNLGTVAKKRNRKSVASKSDTKLKKIKQNNGCLVLHKMDSTESKVEDIKEVVVKAKERGVWFSDEEQFKKITFDVVIIDYVDCLNPKSRYDSDWGGDKEILRDLEKLSSVKHGLGFACWAFTQGGRSSLNTHLVTVEDMGGSIKKAQIAHFIASIAKTLEQRSSGHATFAILGSRLGRDGIIYEDCTFDNANMTIELRKEAKISEITTNSAYT